LSEDFYEPDSEAEEKTKRKIEYSSITDCIKSLIITAYHHFEPEGEKHYSYDPSTNKIVPYDRSLPLGIHLKGLVMRNSSPQIKDVQGLEFISQNMLKFNIDLTTEEEAVTQEFELPIYEMFVGGWRHSKQAWAIAMNIIKKHKLNTLTDYIVFPHGFKPRRTKERIEKMLIILLDKKDLQKIEEWFRENVKKLIPSEEELVPTAVVEEEEEIPRVVPPEVKPLTLKLVPSTAEAKPPESTAVIPQPQREELVKIYLLDMRLPSKYLVQEIEVRDGEEIRKWNGASREVASRLETIRREAYEKISRIFTMAGSSGMWIAVSDEAVREAYEISRWVRKKLKESGIEKIKNIDVDKTYGIDVIEIYMKPDDAKKILERAIETLSQDIEELNKRIAEAEKTNNRNALRRLQNSLEFKKALVEVFKKKLSQLT